MKKNDPIIAILSTLAGMQELDMQSENSLDSIRKILKEMPRDLLEKSVEVLCNRFVIAMQATRSQVELIAICEFRMPPYEVEKINLPTLTGSLLGFDILPIDENKCCATCAFRQGTCANTSPSTMADVIDCIESEAMFYCHENPNGGGAAKHICRGFAQLKN